MGQNQVGQLLHRLGIRLGPQQGGYGILGQGHPGPQDENRHAHAHDSVQPDVQQAIRQKAEEHGGGGDDIVAAVLAGGLQGGGANHFAQAPVEARHPELDQDGRQQNGHRQPIHRDGLGAYNLLEGGFGQLCPGQQHQGGHHHPGYIFVAAMAEGVLLVRRALGHPEAQQRHHRGGRVGEVIDAVAGNGHGAGGQTGGNFQNGQEHVAHNAHRPGQLANGGMGSGRMGGCIRDEQAQ